MSQVKERPILFSAPMVRAILEGRKTVTRRALNAPALKNIGYGVRLGECHDLPTEGPLHPNSVDYYNDFCPYGQPGDRLWVRETWAGPLVDEDQMHLVEMSGWDSFRKPEHCQYRASGGTAEFFDYAKDETVCRWTPSIHMPRWASRILLEITDVRVERLQDITEEQARAEGCFFTDYGQQCFHGATGWKDVGDCPAKVGHQQRNGWAWDKTTSHEQCLFTPRFAFANLWNATGGDWDANPWVWVVEFKRVTP